MDRPNVLSELARGEDPITEILAAVCVHAPIRRLVMRFLCGSEPFPRTKHADFSTQHTLEHGNKRMRPNLVVEAEDLCLVVEVKTSVFRALTENQPGGYLAWMRESAAAGQRQMLVLLAPRHYRHLTQYQDAVEKHCPDHIQHREVFWPDLVEQIDNSGLLDSVLYLRDFRDMLYQQFIHAPWLTLNQIKETDMFSTTAADAFAKVMEIVESTGEEFKACKPDYEVRYVRTRMNRKDGMEYTCVLEGKDEQQPLWFGFWSPLWNEFGWPLAVGVGLDEDKTTLDHFEKFGKSQPEGCHKTHGGYHVARVPDACLVQDGNDHPSPAAAIVDWVNKGYLSEL